MMKRCARRVKLLQWVQNTCEWPPMVPVWRLPWQQQSGLTASPPCFAAHGPMRMVAAGVCARLRTMRWRNCLRMQRAAGKFRYDAA